MRFALALLAMTTFLPAYGGQCAATSGPGTAALVELYTSEGCDSCPPADRWLSALATEGQRVVPIALHVDYWDYIGWKDPYARQAFSARQRKLAQVMKARIVYTPQVLLQGRDFRRWGTSAFDKAVAEINAQPQQAGLSLRIQSVGKGEVDVEVSADLLASRHQADAALYLGAYENKLVSEVRAGENRGKTLQHDYVVLEWQGPIAFAGGGRIAERRRLPLLPKAVPANSGVVAFVQNRATAEVLQALMVPACP